MLKVTILDEALKAIQKKNKELKIVIRHIGCCGFEGRNECGKEFLEYISELTNSDFLFMFFNV